MTNLSHKDTRTTNSIAIKSMKYQGILNYSACIGLSMLLINPAHAGNDPAGNVTNVPSGWDWCEWLAGKPGVLYKNSDNPIIREFQIEGRYQYQVATLDGTDVNGADFNSDYDEHRRFRLGIRTKFAGELSLKSIWNLVGDERPNNGDLDWGYDSFDEFVLSYDIGKALGSGPFDSLVFNYGRQKFILSHEARTSSARLLTIERSSISNKVYASARPTGLTVDAKSGDWSWTFGYFSAGRDGGDNGFLSGYHGGNIFYGHAGWQATKELRLQLDAVYNDTDLGGGSALPYRWAVSLNADYNPGAWGVVADFIFGDNGDAANGVANATQQGGFHGFVVMPYAWVLEDKLQAVLQYQYGGASRDNGIRVNSRYGRAGKNAPANVNGGRGDEHHSVYAGLNYYLCGHNAKIQTGVEYQVMDTPAAGTRGKFDTLTWLAAYRMHF